MAAHIPKILHQIWLGPNESPQKWLSTWKYKHPDWEYHLWTEENIPPLKNQKQFDLIKSYSGKADILRYELLYRYGGFYLDADSECLQPLSESFLRYHFVAFYENEEARPGLLCQCVFGSEPYHPILEKIIIAISNIENINQNPAWVSVGPLLFTQIIDAYKKEGHKIAILPSFHFCPIHFDGSCYLGKGQVFATQHWQTTEKTREWGDILTSCAFAQGNARKCLKTKECLLTKECEQNIKDLCNELNVESVLDAPCSYFRWSTIDFKKYIGIDTSPEVIAENIRQYGTPFRHFECLDLVQHPLPYSDLIFCLDYFCYLSDVEVYTALFNFVKSGAKYLITTHYPKILKNPPHQNGSFRPIHLNLPPFNLMPPLRELPNNKDTLVLFKLN